MMYFDKRTWDLIKGVEPGDLAIILRLVAKDLGLEPDDPGPGGGAPIPPLCKIAGEFLGRQGRETAELRAYAVRVKEQNRARAKAASCARWERTQVRAKATDQPEWMRTQEESYSSNPCGFPKDAPSIPNSVPDTQAWAASLQNDSQKTETTGGTPYSSNPCGFPKDAPSIPHGLSDHPEPPHDPSPKPRNDSQNPDQTRRYCGPELANLIGNLAACHDARPENLQKLHVGTNLALKDSKKYLSSTDSPSLNSSISYFNSTLVDEPQKTSQVPLETDQQKKSDENSLPWFLADPFPETTPAKTAMGRTNPPQPGNNPVGQTGDKDAPGQGTTSVLDNQKTRKKRTAPSSPASPARSARPAATPRTKKKTAAPDSPQTPPDAPQPGNLLSPIEQETPAFELKCKNGRIYPIYEGKIREYQNMDVFWGVDIRYEFSKMRQWLEDNPGRRKTLRGMPSFIGNWLSRQAERIRYGRQNYSQGNGQYSPQPARNLSPEQLEHNHKSYQAAKNAQLRREWAKQQDWCSRPVSETNPGWKPWRQSMAEKFPERWATPQAN